MCKTVICLVSFIVAFGFLGSIASGQENQIVNPEFDDGLNAWGRYDGGVSAGFTIEVVRGAGLSGANAAVLDVINASANASIGLSQGGLLLEPGVTYPIGFTARAEENREMVLLVQTDINGTSWPTQVNQNFQLTTEAQQFEFEYTHSGDVLGDDAGETVTIYLMLKGAWWTIAGDALNKKVWFDRVYFGAEPVVLRGPAVDPSPANEATDVLRDVVLSWTPGEFAPAVNGHIVYFSESFDDVNDGIGGIIQSAASYARAQRLKLETTYYWRVDEVNAPPDSTVYPGEVWSFATEPVGYPIDGANIAATASSVFDTSGPEKTIDGSGLNAGDLHSTNLADMWLTNTAGPQPAWIEYQFDKAYKLREMWVWNQNQVTESAIGYGFRDVSIEYSVDGIGYTTLGTTHEFAQAPGVPDNEHDTTVDLGGLTAKYVRLTANGNWNLGGWLNQYGLSEVRFFYVPVNPREPSPDSGAADVHPDVILGWRAGREAATHNVYLSADEQAVIDGTTSAETVTDASYSPLPLDLGTTYYWRVDEVNAVETPAMWQGDIWSFSTLEYLVVDDFESYNDVEAGVEGSNLVYETWSDGYGTTTNGSAMGYTVAFQPTMETGTVHNGNQSAPMAYDNTTAAFSEVTRTLASQNWTDHGIRTLSLWFFGDPANTPAQLYVKVNGTKIPYDRDAGNLAMAGWQVWNIDLVSSGLNLQSVSSLTIGVEGFGATGTLLLDDIRLYQYPRELITPVQPDPAGLVGHWELDEGSGTTTQDSSGNGRDGTLANGPQWVVGKTGNAVQFDGTDDHVDLGTPAELYIPDNYTYTAWFKVGQNIDGDSGVQYLLCIGSRSDLVFGVEDGVGADGDLSLHYYDTAASFHAVGVAQTVWSSDEWHMVAGTKDSTGHKIYLDGYLRNSDSNTNDDNYATSRMISLGARAWTGHQYFTGTIDDVRIYDRPLSLAEIAGLAGRTQPFDKPF